MDAKTCLAIIQSVVDSQKDLIVVFRTDEVILINKTFKKFVSASSLEQYKAEFGSFVKNFVPHPSYFHKEKMGAEDNWFDAILKLQEIDRVVSMMNSNYEPHAFSVDIQSDVEDYKIVTFTDITQTLIKRIMIENNANMDVKSGAYTKKYFLQIARSYQDAALFNEKIIGVILIEASLSDGSNISSSQETLSIFSSHFKSSIRQDDMLIRWNDNTFLLIFLIDSIANAEKMLEKLRLLSATLSTKDVNCKLSLKTQKENETIKELISRVEE